MFNLKFSDVKIRSRKKKINKKLYKLQKLERDTKIIEK